MRKLIELKKKADQLSETEKLMYDVVTSYDKELPRIGYGSTQFYKKAAKDGNPKAMFVMGAMYHMGEGVTQSESKAIKCYRKAAREGIPEAQFMLGLIYANGIRVKRDEKKGFGLYLKAAKQGLPAAQIYVSFSYFGGDGVEKNFSKAAEWALKAAKQGNCIAEYFFGRLLSLQILMETNGGDPFVWFLRAAIHNHHMAQLRIGKMYLAGEAEPFYKKSDCPGLTPAPPSKYSADSYELYPDAPLDLRERLNREEAHRWLSRAAKAGCVEAFEILEEEFEK
jgi:TPR repeat protein